MAFTHTKMCPDCGAVNDANDLFCKDCGGNLAMVGVSTDQTSAFTPIPQTGATQSTAVAPAIASQPVQASTVYTPTLATTPPLPMQPAYGSMPEEESIRGAVLGWLGALLFLLIVGFFVWSSLLSDATRDRFTGLF